MSDTDGLQLFVTSARCGVSVDIAVLGMRQQRHTLALRGCGGFNRVIKAHG